MPYKVDLMASFDVLVQPFYFDFMMRAFFIAILIAIPTSILSCFLVLKGWSLMGDAVAHAILPGVVIAYMLGFPYVIGAFLAGMLCAVTTGFLSENSRLKRIPLWVCILEYVCDWNSDDDQNRV